MHPVLWLIGYYEIGVPVEMAASFVSVCAALDVDYCDEGIDRVKPCRRFLISARLCPRVLHTCEREGVEATVHSKHGAPVLLLRLFKRPGIALGLLVFATLAALSGRVLWKIEVVGNDTLGYAEVTSMLAECGVRVGAVKSSLDVDKVTNRILINTDKISWMSINIEGNVATVEIREALPPSATEPPACSNVVALENGIVTSFDNVRGNLCVGIGDAVSKGDLLIGGVYGAENEATRFVRASGSVFAKVCREFEINIPLKYPKKVYTGRQKIKKSLIFFEKEVKFFGNSGNYYASCDTIDKVEYFNFFGLGELPIGIRTVTYSEYEYAESVLDKTQARAEAKRVLWQRFYETAAQGAELVSSDIDITFDDNVCRICARVESIEDIAREQEVQINIVG